MGIVGICEGIGRENIARTVLEVVYDSDKLRSKKPQSHARGGG